MCYTQAAVGKGRSIRLTLKQALMRKASLTTSRRKGRVSGFSEWSLDVPGHFAKKQLAFYKMGGDGNGDKHNYNSLWQRFWFIHPIETTIIINGSLGYQIVVASCVTSWDLWLVSLEVLFNFCSKEISIH